MAKFNIPAAKAAVFSPVTTERVPSGLTHEGGSGYARDTRSELFLLAVTNMVGEHTFYESADKRDTRYAELVARAAVEHPDWTARFLHWLRTDGNMRTASLVGAAEYVRARLAASGTGPARKHETADPAGRFEGDNLSYSTISNRAVIDSVLQRADEPGELLAYWTSVHGRAVPKPIKRGIADAATRMYDERAFLKWDSGSRGFRFADVLDLAHPSPLAAWQGDLFSYILDDRHSRGTVPNPETLPTLARRAAFPELMANRPEILLDPDELRRAGFTWEAALSMAGDKVDRAKLWEALIPSMGYMALLRNLRNFDQAGVPDEVAEQVCARLADPAQVARSRQFPMRFLSAYNAAPSLRWGHALDKALTASLANVPALPGRTLVLVDTSSSMNETFSKDGTLRRWDAAAVFSIAVGARCEYADVVSFSSAQRYFNDPAGARTKVFPLTRGESLLRSVDRWKNDGYFLGGGTDTPGAIRAHLRPGFHDRLLIVTDEQTTGRVDGGVPAALPMYTWNLAGYRMGHAPSGVANRHTFGGLTDAAFRMVPLLEAGRTADWPF